MQKGVALLIDRPDCVQGLGILGNQSADVIAVAPSDCLSDGFNFLVVSPCRGFANQFVEVDVSLLQS